MRTTSAAAAALLVLQQQIAASEDPVDAANFLTAVGGWTLARIGFEVTGDAEVQVDIGTEEHPGQARIALTWPLPGDDAPSAPENPVAGDGEPAESHP